MVSLKTAVRPLVFCVVGLHLDMDWCRGHLELNVFKNDNSLAQCLQ